MSEKFEDEVLTFWKKVRLWLKNPTLFLVLVLIVLIIPIALGQMHGKLNNGIDDSPDGYKVTYAFEFLPSVFDVIKESGWYFGAILFVIVLVIGMKVFNTFMEYKLEVKKLESKENQLKIQQESFESLENGGKEDENSKN